MKSIKIFSTKTDKHLKSFIEEAKAMKLKVLFYRYENFSFEDDKLTYAGRKGFPNFTNNDVVLFRRCAYEKQRQHFWLRLIATLAKDAGADVLNENFMVNFPLHSGKLFQAAYFSVYGLPHISTYRLNRKMKTSEFPMLIKKRYTAFGIDSHLVANKQELLDAKAKLKRLDNYVIQPFLELKRDIRVLILNKKILGVVDRKVVFKDDGRITVKVTKREILTSKEKKIVQKALKTFDLDLAGLDLFTSKTGKTWLGEINFFPNFRGYMNLTGENVFRTILETMRDKNTLRKKKNA